MKTNGNNTKLSDYYIGLDVGTSSVGWAVTDTDYQVLRFKGNSMWGARLFEEAVPAADRRAKRTSRRLLQRKQQRIHLLEMLFNNEICKVDPLFFIRMHNSNLKGADRQSAWGDCTLFSDKTKEKEFHKKYPTFYHLRYELIKSKESHDPRLVFLALHHILKNRGHFLFDMDDSSDYKKTGDLLDDLNQYLLDQYGKELQFIDKPKFQQIISDSKLSITEKKKLLKFVVQVVLPQEDDGIDVVYISEALSGAKVKFSDLFNDESLKKAEPASFSLKDDLSEKYDEYYAVIGERIDLLLLLKSVFDAALLEQILGQHEYICEAKIEQYNSNKQDLKLLKQYVRKFEPKKYKAIFDDKKDKLSNYAAYGARTVGSGEYHCKQEDFCKFLKKELADMKNHGEYTELYSKIESGNLLPKLRGSENSVIPNQLQRRELIKILDNAERYLPFLQETDENGITAKEKIISIFDFRIPYYVGPLNKKATHHWAERSDEKIYPWNFEKVVDLKASAEHFIANLTNRCTYTGDDVLPKDSLLYSRYMVLNELNPLKINGNPATVEQKKYVYDNLFVKNNNKVTKKGIKKCLLTAGLIAENDEITGVDDTIKSKLKSFHDFRMILDHHQDESMVEEIIQRVLIFGEDKKMLKNWLKRSYPCLSEEEIRSVCRMKYKDWGRLSKTFLTEIYSPDEHGEAKSIMDLLYDSNYNLNQLLSSEYRFKENAESYRQDKYGVKNSIRDMMDDMYLSPAVKRSILQTLKIVDEIVDIKKSVPKKIFIEVAREHMDDEKGKRTKSRKDRLMELYHNCGQECNELFEKLRDHTDDSALRRDKLYLYYTQFGKCMYSGEAISLDELDSGYDIDHIFPQSRVKDDSIDNRVLVKRQLNENKGNQYPIQENIRTKMYPFWSMLKTKGMISDKKFERLTRNYALSDAELASFVERQLVETRQSTKALAQILKSLYGEAGTKLVYSKAGNVSDFRQEFQFVKCRDINDLHHAKDAYLNIVVGNVYDTKFTEKFFRNIHKENYSLNKVFSYPVPGAWEPNHSAAVVRKMMDKNNVLVTRKAHMAKGQLSDQQLMPAGKGQLPIKQGMDVTLYGGYNKISGAYFCVVEHTDKKKRIRTIEPVYIYQQKLYEEDPVQYCEKVLELREPCIISPCILMDALIEVDGKKIFITGRQGKQLIGKHAYQFITDKETEQYIKQLTKYVERCGKANRELIITEHDHICQEQNEKTYIKFMDKLNSKVYAQFFAGIHQYCLEHFEEFKMLNIMDQCMLLLEILKAFKCNRETVDLSLLNGVKTTGSILLNKAITKTQSAFLIHQSVTGLYEVREDLLR